MLSPRALPALTTNHNLRLFLMFNWSRLLSLLALRRQCDTGTHSEQSCYGIISSRSTARCKPLTPCNHASTWRMQISSRAFFFLASAFRAQKQEKHKIGESKTTCPPYCCFQWSRTVRLMCCIISTVRCRPFFFFVAECLWCCVKWDRIKSRAVLSPRAALSLFCRTHTGTAQQLRKATYTLC